MRNIWGIIALVGLYPLADRFLSFYAGEIEWYRVVTALVIYALVIHTYNRYRKAVKHGNMFGHVFY